MALVNYESSGDESHEEEEEEEDMNDLSKTNSTKSSEKVELSAKVSAEDKFANIFSRLPSPKTLPNPSTLQNSSLNDIVVNKSSSGAIKISVPSLKAYSEEESEDLDDERKSKRFKGSTKGTGLSSILPKPKNSITLKSSSFIPQSLVRPKQNSSSFKKPNVPKNKSDQQLDETNVNYFFDEEKTDNFLSKEVSLSDVEFGPKPDLIANTNNSYAEPSSVPSLDDMGYKRMIASKFGEEAPEQINIVDIDVSKHLSESKDWLKTISEEKEEEYTGVQPSSTARRKHQITFLALQAKQREVELKNEWAQSRTTKTMSRAKYGF